jgi:multimeric flavodoxin WrbA
MRDPANVAVIYYSATGTIYELARNVAEGAREQGATVRLLKVQELAPAGLARRRGKRGGVAEQRPPGPRRAV